MKKILFLATALLFLCAPANAQSVSGGGLSGVKWVDGKPRISSMPYTYDIAEGNVSGHTPWSKIGYVSTASTNYETVWPVTGTYYPPVSGCSMQVYSSSASDTSAGSGIRTATIYYLDSNYIEKSETVTLSGIAAVTTVATDIFRVNAFRATSVGAGAAAAGNVDLRNSLTGNTIYARIGTGFTRGRNSFYTVPANTTLYVTSIMFSSSLTTQKASARFTTRATYDEKLGSRLSPLFYMPFHEVFVTDSTFFRELEIPTKLPEKTDLKVSVQTSSSGANCSIALRGWIEKN